MGQVSAVIIDSTFILVNEAKFRPNMVQALIKQPYRLDILGGYLPEVHLYLRNGKHVV